MIYVYKTDVEQKNYDFLGAASDRYKAWTIYAMPVVIEEVGKKQSYITRHWMNEEGFEIIDFGSWVTYIAYLEK